MKIGIDGRVFQGKRTGVGRYVFELCRCLDSLLPEAQFFVYSNIPVEMPFQSHRWKVRLDPSTFAKRMKPVLWLKLRCGGLCRLDNLDVFWGPAAFLPSLRKEIRTVITIHDFSFELAPETMSFFHRWAHYLFFEMDLQRANAVTTNSRGTSSRLLELFGRHADAVILPAADSKFRPRTAHEAKAVLDRYSISVPYILSVATWEPRKNIPTLIEAFLDLKRRGQLTGYKLVLVGGRGWKDRKLASLVQKLERDNVIPVGYVPDEHLPFLYSGAELFVFPSTYEGFGMPVLEARACGTRVVTSDIPELREAGGSNSVYVIPTAQGIREGILAVLPRGDRIESADLLPYSWQTGAADLAAVLVGGSAHGLHGNATHD